MGIYYQESGITIYHGDCREILPTLGKVDLLLTDPPYGLGIASRPYCGDTRATKKWSNPTMKTYEVSDWDGAIPETSTFEAMFRISTHKIVFGGNYFGLPASRCWLVWDKVATGDFADCELAWTNFDKSVRKFTWLWNGFKKQQPEDRFHPTQKPLAVMKWAISQAPDTVKTILDPFMGSGTTLVAAKDLGLSAIGIEREEKYCEIAVNRLRQNVFSF